MGMLHRQPGKEGKKKGITPNGNKVVRETQIGSIE